MRLAYLLPSLALGAALTVAAVRPTAELPGAGTPAPEIRASAWFNHLGADPDLASLRGQTLLLEFWATW
ncbi:MAG: hypothetical protein H6828_01735 [Planctomycetes bacterium]|nr:hypothetical protein [Planctomycetota bacterium]